MKKQLFIILLMFFLSVTLSAQKTVVQVAGYYEIGAYGTLNDAIDAAIANGTINNTIFQLNPYEVYVLSRSIYIDHSP